MGYGKGNPGRPIGTSKYPYREDYEREIVVKMLRKGGTDADIAAAAGWTDKEVRDTRARFFPRNSLAHAYLQASTLTLAERIVEECNVEEAMDLLSRPNIGVLEPVLKAQNQPKIGIITNINTSTLGGVQPSSQTQVFTLNHPGVENLTTLDVSKVPDPRVDGDTLPHLRELVSGVPRTPYEQELMARPATIRRTSVRTAKKAPTKPTKKAKSTPKRARR